MQQHPTELKLGRLLTSLLLGFILMAMLVFGSLTFHYQIQKQQQLTSLVATQMPFADSLNLIQYKKQLHQVWLTFKIAYPNTEFAIIQIEPDASLKILGTSIEHDENAEQAKTHLLQLTETYLEHQPLILPLQTQTRNDILSLLQNQYLTLNSGNNFFLAPLNSDRSWYFAAYQKDGWLPLFAQQSLQNTLWALLGLLAIFLGLFFFSLRKAAKRLLSVQERYHQFLDHNLDWVWEVDTQGTIIYSSEHSFSLIGYENTKLLGVKLFSLIEANYQPENVQALRKNLHKSEPFYNVELGLKHSGKKLVYGVFYGQPFFDKQQQLSGFRGTCRNITPFKERQDHLIEQLNFDPVTELPNRVYLINSMHHLFEDLTVGNHFALLMLDLHGLQEVNNCHGHRYSTLALHLSAERIRKTVPQSHLVARLNGTEFAVLVRTPFQGELKKFRSQLELVSEELIYELNQPMMFEQHSFSLQANVGITLIPDVSHNASSALAAANQALYESKKTGYNHLHFATKEPNNAHDPHAQTLENLKHAFENNELRLRYQLQVNALEHKIIGFEALLRWQDPVTKKLIKAQEFISIAVEHNKILQLELWVLNQMFADWQSLTQSLNLQPSEISKLPSFVMNVSSESLLSDIFKQTLRERLSTSNLPASKLRFEISESQLIRHANRAILAMNELADTGIEFCIDHFGTGWSNLSYLQSLPISHIKLSQNETIDLANNPQHLELSQTIVQLAHSLQLKVIAEGVETEIQKELLQKIGCLYMQGYLFSECVDLKKLTTLVEKQLNERPTLQ